MPAPIPAWWLALSGLFFFAGFVLFAVLAVVAWKFYVLARGVANDLGPKVGAIATKVDSIGGKVDDLTAIARDVAAKVGQQAQGVSASANEISKVAATQIERFGPIVAGAAAAIKVLDGVRNVLFFRAIARAKTRSLERGPKR